MVMVARTDRPLVDWARWFSGFGILVMAAFALLGFLVGGVSQLVLFGEYEARVEAMLYRPLILPCVAALALTGAGAIMWWSAFVKRRTSRSRIAPYLAGALGALLVAGALMPPTERELEARWTEKLERLQLPAQFTPLPLDKTLRSDRYEVSRHWATEQHPEQVCGAVERALKSWLGSASVDRAGDNGCYLSAVDGRDSVSSFFLDRRTGAPGPEILEVRITYNL